MLFKTIVLLILLILSAFFSGSETAFMCLGKFKYKEYLKKKKINYNLVHKLKSKPHVLISTVLIGNNVVNIGATAVATLLGAEFFLNLGWTLSEALSAGIVTGIMTIIVLVFCEVLPKNYASKHYEKIVGKTAKPLYLLSLLFKPLILLLDFVNRKVVKAHNEEKITEDEIKTIVSVGSEEGGIDSYEKNLIHKIFLFDDITTKEVMTPRPKVFVLEANSKIKDVLALVIEESYSRVPVYEDNLDNIIGFFRMKDFLKANLEGKEDELVKTLVHKIFYVPESKPINTLFKEMQKKRIQMAVVVDEFGGFSGIVTVEDLIEEIFGEIYDEDEHSIKLIKKINNNYYLVGGETSIREIKDTLNIEFEDALEAETIGAYILSKMEKIPKKGETLTIKNIKIIIDTVTETTIETVRLKY